MPTRPAHYWLMKSEPGTFSFDDLMRAPKKRTFWDGVRNYQARNLMRDEMAKGDGVLFYHSNAKPPGVAGIARVVGEAYPDHTQFDPKDSHFDAKSDADDPTWLMVDIQGVRALSRFVSLDEMKAAEALSEMMVTRRGSRLSVQPVTPREWKAVHRLGGLKAEF
jgi:predicted RNA-binding protein with PUA-like domain